MERFLKHALHFFFRREDTKGETRKHNQGQWSSLVLTAPLVCRSLILSLRVFTCRERVDGRSKGEGTVVWHHLIATDCQYIPCIRTQVIIYDDSCKRYGWSIERIKRKNCFQTPYVFLFSQNFWLVSFVYVIVLWCFVNIIFLTCCLNTSQFNVHLQFSQRVCIIFSWQQHSIQTHTSFLHSGTLLLLGASTIMSPKHLCLKITNNFCNCVKIGFK